MIQFGRIIMLVLLSFNILLTLLVWNIEMLFYFTHWTLLLTTASVAMSYKVASDTNAPKNTGRMAVHHLLYTLSIIFNCVSFPIYWILIHDEVTYLIKYTERWKYAQQIINHLLPPACCLIHTYLTNCVLTRKLIKHILLGGLSYLSLDYFYVKVTGDTVFWFLHWDTMETPIFGITLVLGFGFVYILVCGLDEIVKEEGLNLKFKKALFSKVRAQKTKKLM